MNKYKKVLTIFLILIIIIVITILSFILYKSKENKIIIEEADSAFLEIETLFENNKLDNEVIAVSSSDIVENEIDIDEQNNSIANTGSTTTTTTTTTKNTTSTSTNTNKTTVTTTYKGHNVVGLIQIPKTGIKYPVLENESGSALNVSIAKIYGTGLNRPGITILVGHNYRNKLFFSKNKNLVNGDIIYITDTSGTKLEYIVYDKFETVDTDTSFYIKNPQDGKQIALSTCTDANNEKRLIILAKEK